MRTAAIPVGYLAKISDDNLLNLSATISTITKTTFGKWLHSQLLREAERRMRDGSDDPLEAEQTELPIFGWTNSELAFALVRVTTLSFVVDDPATSDFVNALAGAITCLSASRLEESHAIR
ncbi:MAG: hypothetical protein HOH82_12425 [Planctomycetaceae bacterium]|jgi:hypothetical protein|nr:hypothetical protein [Planctomycetaceae bacterium]